MRTKGFLLVDVLIAAAFLGVITVTLFPTIGFLLRRNKITQGTVEANLLVQEGIEIAYNAFANDWHAYPAGSYIKAFDSGNNTYILTSGMDEAIEAKYTRTITISDIKRSSTTGQQDDTGNPDSKSKKITTSVTWKQGEEDVTQQASLLLYEF